MAISNDCTTIQGYAVQVLQALQAFVVVIYASSCV
jgi:hypothetical protein